MAAEMCLMQLPHLIANPTAEFKPSSFFSEQLTAFDLWLAHGAQDKKPPEQLPIVLQVGRHILLLVLVFTACPYTWQAHLFKLHGRVQAVRGLMQF